MQLAGRGVSPWLHHQRHGVLMERRALVPARGHTRGHAMPPGLLHSTAPGALPHLEGQDTPRSPHRASCGVPRAAGVVVRAQSPGGAGWNPVEVVKRERGLQSNRLQPELREAVVGAVEELNFRVTVGDVAARTGTKVSDADTALQALAYDAQATLEVSDQGDVVYTFPRDFRTAIQAKSVWIRVQPVLASAQRAVAYLLRVAFGTALFASVAIVWFAITVLLSSRDRDDRRSNNGGMFGGGYYGGYGPRMYFNITDLLFYMDPSWSASRNRQAAEGGQLNFLEAIFSFVFGDGDPNADFELQRWAALAAVIRARGGVVTAEEMAPFLDPPAGWPSRDGEDESFVLPAVIRFGGEVSVDDATGGLLYTFPMFQASGVAPPQQAQQAQQSGWLGGWTRQPPSQPVQETAPELVQEEQWELTAASAGQVAGVVALGVFNLVGVALLAGLLAEPGARYALSYQGLGWVAGLLPVLQAYAATFFGIPAVRALLNARRNALIEERNEARSAAARALNSGRRWLREKLTAARRLGRSRSVRASDVVFTTDKAAEQQMNEKELSEWDAKFGGQGGVREPPQRQPQPDPQRSTRSEWRQGGSAWDREGGRSSAGGQGGGVGQRRLRDFDGNWK